MKDIAPSSAKGKEYTTHYEKAEKKFSEDLKMVGIQRSKESYFNYYMKNSSALRAAHEAKMKNTESK